MRRILSLLSFLAAACSSVEDRPACSASSDCAAGQYCAHTADGNVCWADPVAPTVTGVTVTPCEPSPCRRDGVLHVVASVSDDKEVLDAMVALDLAPAQTVPMTRSGSGWAADVPLRNYPFDAFERTVTATVTARDGARNGSAAVAGSSVSVTRMRWDPVVIDSATGFTPTVPAVMPNGTVVIAGSTGKLYFIAAGGAEAEAPLQVATGQITAAPAVGERAIWVGSEDFSLYGVKLDGTGLLAGVGVATAGAIKGSVAVMSEPGEEWAFVASSAGWVGASSSVQNEHGVAGPTEEFVAGPVIGETGRLYAATSSASASVRAYTFNSALTALTPTWSSAIGPSVMAPLAVDGAGNIWTGSLGATLSRTAPSDSEGKVTTVAPLPGSILDSPVILSGGDVVVGDQSGTLLRVAPDGTVRWSRKLNGDAMTNEPLLAPLVLADGSATLLVPTKTGVLYALDGSGNEVWRTTLATGAELRSGNIYTVPDQPAGQVLSTAYFPAANGKLFAVIVDGKLDATSPWPKAFHDPRNTNRAGAQP